MDFTRDEIRLRPESIELREGEGVKSSWNSFLAV